MVGAYGPPLRGSTLSTSPMATSGSAPSLATPALRGVDGSEPVSDSAVASEAAGPPIARRRRGRCVGPVVLAFSFPCVSPLSALVTAVQFFRLCTRLQEFQMLQRQLTWLSLQL